MKIIIQRANQDFGPYPLAVVEKYLAQGSLLPHDLAREAGTPPTGSVPLSRLLARAGIKNPIAGNPLALALQNLKSFDLRLLFPWTTIRSLAWLNDKRLMYFAGVGLAPIVGLSIATWLTDSVSLAYWMIALYFSVLWAMFFYFLFRTPQVVARTCVISFSFTAVVSISVLLFLYRLPPWDQLMALTESRHLLARFPGFVLGVGVPEELCKAAILFWLVRRPGFQLTPQTVVFYGMMSGLGFGIYEGVQYQTGFNRTAGVDTAYLLNIARLTSLPFLHAVWTGLAGYFIGFAALYPRKRYGLWIVAIAVPALFHGLYDTFNWGVIGLSTAFLSVILLSTYLANVQQMQRHFSAP